MAFNSIPVGGGQGSFGVMPRADHGLLLRGIQFPTRGSSLRTIYDVVKDVVHGATELFRQTAKDAFRPFSGAIKQIALQMIREEKEISRLRLSAKSDLPPPKTMPENYSAVWQSNSAQIPAEKIPEGIIKGAQNLHKMSYDDGTYGERNEFADLIIELSDGRFFRSYAIAGTSYKEDSVSYELAQHLPQFNDAQVYGKQKPERLSGSAKVWLFHTHPQTLNQIDATKLHQDGKYFTFLSAQDCRSTDKIFETIVDQLRRRGFAGKIEVIEAVIPVPLRPIDDLKENVYIVTYTRSSNGTPS